MIEEQIWQNAFYNALSTVAQTLAAAFGILATFMLFRFEHAEGKIKTHGADISESVSTLEVSVTPELMAQLKEGDPASAEMAMKEVIDQAASKGAKRRWGNILPSQCTILPVYEFVRMPAGGCAAKY